MIVEKTRAALAVLFPESATDDSEIEAVAEAPEETEKKAAKKSAEPRKNGIILRDYTVHGYHIDVQLDPSQLLEAVALLDSLDYFIESITGVDWIKEEQMEAIYDFSRYDFDLCRVVLRVRTPRAEPSLPSITSIYAGANWHERETHDFFGIDFTGHPHLVPLLLPEDADFHPLLKDFKA